MPELIHAWAETLDGQVSRGRCGIVTLTYLFSRDGRETCPHCRGSMTVLDDPWPSEAQLEAQRIDFAAHAKVAADALSPAPEPTPVPEVPIEEGQRRMALLRACIAKSGMSNSAYARDVLVRAPRSVRRWLAGDAPIPQQVLAFMEKGG